jgi:hypothetical protein
VIENSSIDAAELKRGSLSSEACLAGVSDNEIAAFLNRMDMRGTGHSHGMRTAWVLCGVSMASILTSQPKRMVRGKSQPIKEL